MTPEQLLIFGVKQKAYPQYIFKYRNDNENTENIITDNKLWFADPTTFNDSYDCNTPINTNTLLVDIKKWLTDIGVRPQGIDVFADTLKNNPHIAEEETKKSLARMGICCFSTMDNSILQWSHYSGYHKGVCLKFDITQDPNFFSIPVIVAYRKVMQHYNHLVQSKNIIDYLIKPKFHEWSYENEIRIVKTAEAIKNNGCARAFKFQDSALKEVIFGTNAPYTAIQKYKRLCNTNNKQHVQFYKMSLGNGVHYELIKNPCP